MSKHNRGWVRTPIYEHSQSGGLYKRPDRRLGSVSAQMLFTCLMLGGFILFFMPQHLTNKLQFAFARGFHLPLGLGRNISLSTGIERSVSSVVSYGIYNRLQNHLANVMEQLYQEHQLVEVLSGLRGRFPLEGANLVCADVITASISAECSELIINRGANDGMAKGRFVLGDNSIIGTISDVSPRTAQVKFFTDPTSKIAVKIEQLDTDRLIHGSGNDYAKIKLLSTKYKVRVGDKVLACKKPGFLDVPMIIGKVAACERDNENPSLWDITVRPVCDIERINRVSVLIMNLACTY